MSHALLLLHAVYAKTKGRDRAVRDVTELETGLTADEARAAWRELLEQGLVERFSQDYVARLSLKAIELLANSAPIPVVPAPSVVITRGVDTAAGQAVADFLTELRVGSVAFEGPGLMQMVESQTRLSFAVVLLTPDDLTPARLMHALMDVGYLMGRFGAGKVLAFTVDGEAADLPGLTVHRFDEDEAWKSVLTVGLREAGLSRPPQT